MKASIDAIVSSRAFEKPNVSINLRQGRHRANLQGEVAKP